MAPVLARRVPVIAFILPLAVILHLYVLASEYHEYRDRESRHWLQGKIYLTAELKSKPGQDVVLVRYKKGHWVHAEWVYNGADIDGADIVWARFMDDDTNQRLAEYYSGRQIWIATVGRSQDVRLEPYLTIE